MTHAKSPGRQRKVAKPNAERRQRTETLAAPDDLWLSALGATLLKEFEEQGAGILSEFGPANLAKTLRRKLTSAQRAHLDYVIGRLLEWRSLEPDYEGEMPWDPDEPWTGPTHDAAAARRVLEHAIKRGSDVEIDYFTHARGEYSTRRVTPRGLEGRYLVAHCHLRNEERTFRIERIARAQAIEPARRRRATKLAS